MAKVEEHLTASERRGGRVFRNLRDDRRQITGRDRSDHRSYPKLQNCDLVGPRVSEGSPASPVEDPPKNYIATSAKEGGSQSGALGRTESSSPAPPERIVLRWGEKKYITVAVSWTEGQVMVK